MMTSVAQQMARGLLQSLMSWDLSLQLLPKWKPLSKRAWGY